MSFTSAFQALFWGLLVLSLLVGVHEAGHFFAARLCGARVSEFFLGMPSRLRLSFTSKRYGTEIGVTPILLGGYTRICGMEGTEDELLASAFKAIQAQGTLTNVELAESLSDVSPERAKDMLDTLCDWGSITRFVDDNTGELIYSTVLRDGKFLTEFDKDHDFSDGATTADTDPRPLELSAAEALEFERSHTYLGCNYLQRIFMLAAGPLVNILLAFAIVVSFFTLIGAEAPANINVLGGVVEDSFASAAGLQPGDEIIELDGAPISDWTSLVDALDGPLNDGRDFELVYVRDGVTGRTIVDLPDGEEVPLFGIQASYNRVKLSLGDSFSLALDYAKQVAMVAVQILMPSHTREILDQSTSVVGISVMASEAAQTSIGDLFLIIAAVSMSLGFMNLLPIPPLDGGKMLIETIQLIIRRPLSLKAQAAISYIGLAFFLFIFVYVLRNDLSMIVGG